MVELEVVKIIHIRDYTHVYIRSLHHILLNKNNLHPANNIRLAISETILL